MSDWEQHCPVDEEEWPVQRQAWRGGWEYRIEHGPGLPDKETIVRMVDRPSLLSVWVQGFEAADEVDG